MSIILAVNLELFRLYGLEAPLVLLVESSDSQNVPKPAVSASLEESVRNVNSWALP